MLVSGMVRVIFDVRSVTFFPSSALSRSQQSRSKASGHPFAYNHRWQSVDGDPIRFDVFSTWAVWRFTYLNPPVEIWCNLCINKKTELWGLKFDTLEDLGNDKFTVITQVYKVNPFPKAKWLELLRLGHSLGYFRFLQAQGGLCLWCFRWALKIRKEGAEQKHSCTTWCAFVGNCEACLLPRGLKILGDHHHQKAI